MSRRRTDEALWNVKQRGTGQAFRRVDGKTPYHAKATIAQAQTKLTGKSHHPADFEADPDSDEVKREAPMDFDNTDSPFEPRAPQARRPPPIPVKVKDASGRPVPPKFLPGANNAPYTRGQKNEAGPFGTDQRSSSQPGVAQPGGERRRSRAPTEPIPIQQDQSFDVTIPGVGTYRVSAPDEARAGLGLSAFIKGPDNDDPDTKGKYFDPKMFKIVRSPQSEGSTGGDLAGYQSPEEALEGRIREMVQRRLAEIVRKKAGGGGYVLYGPNKGKKKQAKPSGEFPTRLAAKRAELARFPPKDPEQLKRARKRLDKLLKDPKKRAAAEKEDLSGRKKPKRSGVAARERKKAVREQFVHGLVGDLMERLFHEDEIPGSPWDERIASLAPDVIASDKVLAKHHKGIQAASTSALGDAHKGLARVLRGVAKVNPGDVAHDPDRKKTFIPVMLDVDGTEVGPVHLYVDGGHVKIEVSQDARDQISGLEPECARDLRGGLMSFQEDHLPQIDQAQKAWSARDAYLDKLHGKLEKHATGLSGVEHHLLKGLLGKGGKKK